MFWKYLICFLYCVMCINIVSFLFIIMAVQISLYHTGKYMVHPLQKITSYATVYVSIDGWLERCVNRLKSNTKYLPI